MTEKERLVQTLFNDPARELVDIKFMRLDNNKAISETAFCARVNKIVFEIDAGLTNVSDGFTADNDKSVDVKELVKRLRPQAA